MTNSESAPTPLSAEQSRQARLDRLATDAAANSDLYQEPTIIDKRLFHPEEAGIYITANSFDVDSLNPQASQLESRDTLSSTSPDIVDTVITSPLNTEASITEVETTPEKKKKVWFKRLGYAASMHFKIARGIGVKNYAGEIKDSIQTAVSEKIDAGKAKVYQKTEETLWKLADDINVATEKVAGTYKRTKEELGAEYTAFKQGFTADLENAMGMWLAYREQARVDKAARKKYVNDRIMEYALKRERQLVAAHGASL